VILLAPKMVAMVAVLVVGYVLARWVAGLVAVVSEKIGLQTAAEKSGLAKSMHDVGIRRPVPGIVGGIVFWLLMCVFVMAAFNILGLESVSDAMGEVVNYIPRLLVATVVVVVGLLAATFIRGVVATSADRVGLSYAEYLAGGCYWVLSILTFIAAFNQLGIQFALLEKLILIGSAGLAAGFALAFGLGGRDVMAGILAGYYVRQRLQAGDTVSVAGFEGTVREVGPVATVIETRDGGVVSRHSIPNSRMLQEAVR
jgi:small-conductance mechanosensitive channel